MAYKTGDIEPLGALAFAWRMPGGCSNTGSKALKPRSGDKSCIQDLASLSGLRGIFMTDTIVKLRLNQQQLELMDRTIAQGVAADRIALVRLALREYAAAHKADAATEAPR
jgi:hypothetical protein